MGLLETAAATLVGGERTIEVTARNVTNVNTPGYKREISFTTLVSDTRSVNGGYDGRTLISSAKQMSQAALTLTGKALDLAINGPGMLLLRSGDGFVLSRGGQFALGPGGTMIDPLGRVLQQATGGDLVLQTSTPEILADGTVLDDGSPIGAIAIVATDEAVAGATLSLAEAQALPEAPDAELRQGMLERSNVTLSDEMIELMRAQRQVEAGAQMVRAYDRLMNQAIATFSRSG
jgi:flagellar basal body rod protein FlgG